VSHRSLAAVLSGLSPADRVLFERFGAGPAADPAYTQIHHAFEARARACPAATAVTHLGRSISFDELDRQANRLAALLASCGVGPGSHVGLFVRRSIPMVVGILGVLKAGAAYVPQDVRISPRAQLDHIVSAASIDVVLTLSEYAADVPGRVVLSLDDLPDVEGPVAGRPGDTAVVIFTSGTTGTPNGVAVTHANLCNMLLTEPGSLGMKPGQRVGQVLNIAFDMAVWEILGALSYGATLVIRGADIEETARTLDVLIATPGVLATLDPDRCRRISTVAVAGERCPRPLAETWAAFAKFHNACGPTEVTIVNTLARAYRRGSARVTIGGPLPNTTVYVLDAELRPCAIGDVGEMWAGGACVTAGYLGNPELTAERYRPDPFRGGLMFRTRDLGRWTPDGELEHHGRTDDQVKVRGFRVELDAVTSVLERVPGCRRATTLLADGELVSFVSPASVDPDAARAAVEAQLPYYSVPSSITPVDQLPMTARGKVDKSALLSRPATRARAA
jgi:D-alanine--poly(phosphoribitol) ligase subunit 1